MHETRASCQLCLARSASALRDMHAMLLLFTSLRSQLALVCCEALHTFVEVLTRRASTVGRTLVNLGPLDVDRSSWWRMTVAMLATGLVVRKALPLFAWRMCIAPSDVTALDSHSATVGYRVLYRSYHHHPSVASSRYASWPVGQPNVSLMAP